MAQCLNFLHFGLFILAANGLDSSHFLIPQAPLLHRERNKPRAIPFEEQHKQYLPHTLASLEFEVVWLFSFCFFQSMLVYFISCSCQEKKKKNPKLIALSTLRKKREKKIIKGNLIHLSLQKLNQQVQKNGLKLVATHITIYYFKCIAFI